MRIGVDLDGVVYDSEIYLRTKIELADYDMKGKGLVDSSNWSCKKRHDWGENLFPLLNQKRLETVEHSNLMPGVVEVLDRLKKEFSIYIVTSRGLGNSKEIKITYKRLKKDKIPFDKIILCKNSKVQECIDNKIDVMIEDRPENVQELSSNGIKCLYWREAEMLSINDPNVIEVYNWGQIYRILKDMKK